MSRVQVRLGPSIPLLAFPRQDGRQRRFRRQVGPEGAQLCCHRQARVRRVYDLHVEGCCSCTENSRRGWPGAAPTAQGHRGEPQEAPAGAANGDDLGAGQSPVYCPNQGMYVSNNTPWGPTVEAY